MYPMVRVDSFPLLCFVKRLLGQRLLHTLRCFGTLPFLLRAIEVLFRVLYAFGGRLHAWLLFELRGRLFLLEISHLLREDSRRGECEYLFEGGGFYLIN
jgi:hypothetical protein